MRLVPVRRRGSSNIQWIVIAAVVVLGLVGTWAVLGSRTNTKMQQNAEDVGDPTRLVERFGY